MSLRSFLGFSLLVCACDAERPSVEPEPEPPLAAEVLWNFEGDCPPEQIVAVGSRIITPCRLANDFGVDLHSRVLDVATGETLSDWVHVLPDANRPIGSFVIGVNADGGLGVVTIGATDVTPGGVLLLPLDADGRSAAPAIELGSRAALPSFEAGEPTFLSAPLDGGTWQLSAIENGEQRTVVELGFSGAPLARARLAGGYGVLHSEPTGACSEFDCVSSVRWTRFDDAGEQLSQVELASDFQAASLATSRLVQSDDGFVIAIAAQAGVRWFRLDANGVVVSSPTLLETGKVVVRVALAPLLDGELLLATIESEGAGSTTYQLRLLAGDEVEGGPAHIPRSRPGADSAFFEAVSTPEGALLLTGRYGGDGGYLGEAYLSGVLVNRP